MASRDEDIIRLIQGEHTDAIRRIEDQAIEAAVGGMDEQFTEAARDTTALWTRLFGGPHADAVDDRLLARIIAAVRQALDRLFDGLGRRSQRALDEALNPAAALGVAQGAQVLSLLTGRRVRGVDAKPSRAQRRAARALPDVVDEQHRSAVALLKTKLIRRLGLTGALAAIGRGRGVSGRVKAAITHTVNETVNEAIAEQVRAAGAKKVWVSERDACVTCAAYAGLVVDEDADFPGGLSWDPNQRGRTEAIASPPRHPNCRCRIAPWRDEWAEPGVASMPEALRREAWRSIARGWSLPTESNAARIRAARELLRTGVRLPKSVLAFADRAVRAGRFADRTFPATGPGAGR